MERRGCRHVGRHFVVVAALGERTDGCGRARLGITVSRRIGGAVVRNRVKRRIREWFRREGAAGASGLDLLVIARRDAGQLGWQELAEGLQELLDAAARKARV
jgi:ribonuclease P protein component